MRMKFIACCTPLRPGAAVDAAQGNSIHKSPAIAFFAPAKISCRDGPRQSFFRPVHSTNDQWGWQSYPCRVPTTEGGSWATVVEADFRVRGVSRLNSRIL